MKYFLNMCKTFIFDQNAINEIAETKIKNSILVILFAEIISFSAKILIDGNNIGNISKQIIFNFILLLLRILILFLLLHKNIALPKKILGIINANLIIGAVYCFIILVSKNSIYSIINTVIIVYSLYYLYRFFKIVFPSVNKFILEGYIILSALIAKLITLGILLLFNTLF